MNSIDALGRGPSVSRWWLALCLLFIASVHAYPVTTTVVSLAHDGRQFQVAVVMPENLLAQVVGADVAMPAQLDGYVRQHLAFRSEGNDPWRLTLVDSQQVTQSDGPIRVLHYRAAPPDAGSGRTLKISSDLLRHAVGAHRVQVVLVSDWRNGIVPSSPQLLGAITGDEPLTVSLATGSWRQGVMRLFERGMADVADGKCLWLPLVLLLLTAPMRVDGRRWRAAEQVRMALRRTVELATLFGVAFGIGVALGSLGWLPDRTLIPDVLLAAALLVAAIHLCFPLLRTHDGWVIAFIALLEGSALALPVGHWGMQGTELWLVALVYCSGGAVLMGLIALLVAPWFILLAPAPGYVLLRGIALVLAGASLIGLFLDSRGDVGIFNWHAGITDWGRWLLLWLAATALLTRVAARFQHRWLR